MCVSPINKVEDGLYIGDHNAAFSRRILRNNGITHIINCAAEVKNYFPSEFTYLNLGLMDSDDSLKDSIAKSVRFIRSALSSSPRARVLVHCHMGISRSASMVIAYLVNEGLRTGKTTQEGGEVYDIALGVLQRIRPVVRPNPVYEKQLRFDCIVR